MKIVSVMVPKEKEGGFIKDGALVGACERSRGYQLDDGQVYFDRNEAREIERQREFRVQLHEALQLDSIRRADLSPKDFLDLILRHETKVRAVMMNKRLKKLKNLMIPIEELKFDVDKS